ncbi:MAG: hypothetical protein HYY84_03745 [Deltaproteobacteria bacterium]|nr:hypothetical protein [Deltaproteobacteria bacterium]
MKNSTRSLGLMGILGALGVAPLVASADYAPSSRIIYGTWHSTSGNLFEIHSTDDGAFRMTMLTTNGTQSVMRGHWIAGLRGTQFQYFGPDGRRYSGTFSGRDPNRVRVAGASQVSWWKRGATAVAPRSSKLFGTWRSGSGNVFEIRNTNDGRFSLVVTFTDGRKSVMRGSWVRGFRGSRFQYHDADGHRYVAGFSSTDPDRVRVVSDDGTINWWRRSFATVQASDGESPSVERDDPYATPVPTPAPAPTIVCWTADDDGCKRMKNGKFPMDQTAFRSFLKAVSSARPHVFSMKDRVRASLGNRYMTSLQLARLLDEFKPHVYVMLDVVKICAQRLVDAENGAGPIAEKFAPHTFVGNDAVKALGAER